MQNWRREFSGSLANISEAARWVDQIVADRKLPDDKAYALKVCLEEILTNIVRHGGSPSPKIVLGLALFQNGLKLTVEDDGKPFDLATSPPRRVDRPLENAKIGGLGIQLIHSFADRLSYTRVNDKNRVVAEFILPEFARPGLERSK